MNNNIFSTEGDLIIKYTLKIDGEIPVIGSVPFILRYYNPLDEKKYYEASYDGSKYTNITPKEDYYIIAIDNINLLPGRMFCWERIMHESIYFEDGKRTESSRYDIGEIVRIMPLNINLNEQINFSQGIYISYPSRYVSSLPLVGESNIIYFTPHINTNTSDLFIYADGQWNNIGNTSIDFSEYYTKNQTNILLSYYVEKEANKRLITESEAMKISNSVEKNELEKYSLKETNDLSDIILEYDFDSSYIKVYNESESQENKIQVLKIIMGQTARDLDGEINGINNEFSSKYKYIYGSEKLNINGRIYYENNGFYYESEKIIILEHLIPQEGDTIFLEAIYI